MRPPWGGGRGWGRGPPAADLLEACPRGPALSLTPSPAPPGRPRCLTVSVLWPCYRVCWFPSVFPSASAPWGGTVGPASGRMAGWFSWHVGRTCCAPGQRVERSEVEVMEPCSDRGSSHEAAGAVAARGLWGHPRDTAPGHQDEVEAGVHQAFSAEAPGPLGTPVSADNFPPRPLPASPGHRTLSTSCCHCRRA